MLHNDDPAAGVPRIHGVLIDARHDALLHELEAALDRSDDDLLTEAVHSGLQALYSVLVHAAYPHPQEGG